MLQDQRSISGAQAFQDLRSEAEHADQDRQARELSLVLYNLPHSDDDACNDPSTFGDDETLEHSQLDTSSSPDQTRPLPTLVCLRGRLRLKGIGNGPIHCYSLHAPL